MPLIKDFVMEHAVPWARKRISGKDDDYNTVEGLRHGGLAGKLRKQNTDFGSGWQGTSEENKSVPDNLRRRFHTFETALKQHGKKVGTGHERILIPKSALSRENIEQLGFESVLLAIPESGQTRLASYRSTANNYHIHEHGPYWTMHEDEHAAATMKVKNIKNPNMASKAWAYLEGMPHVIAEGVPGLYYYMKNLIGAGEDMAEKLQRVLPKEYMNRVAKLPRISGKDDAYNTVEGLRHGGMAEKKRKELTEFGSGWDKLRALTKHLKGGYEKYIKSTAFQQALPEGRIVPVFNKKLGEMMATPGNLGAGTQGRATLMETTLTVRKKGFWGIFGKNKFHDVNFRYVHKELHKGSMANVFRETAAMKKLSDLNAPTFYGHGRGKSFYMEYFEGKDVRDMFLSGEQIPAEAVKDISSFVQKSHKRGVAHMDIGRDVGRDLGLGRMTGEMSPRNMVLTPEGRIGVIDYGLWQSPKANTSDIMTGWSTGSSISDTQDITIGQFALGNIDKIGKARDMDNALIASLQRNKGRISDTHGRIRRQQTADTGILDMAEAPTQATPAAASIALERAAERRANRNVSVRIGMERKQAMSQTQIATTASMFENARSGGKRSASTFAGTGKL